MDRRALLKTGTMGLLGLGFGGCATGSGREGSLVLAPVRAFWDRVIAVRRNLPLGNERKSSTALVATDRET